MKTVQGLTGTFYRLTCLSNDGSTEIHATCDEKYREHLRPYLDLLVKSKEGLATETPVVPVFQGDDTKWRFSWIGAEKDYPEVKERARQNGATPTTNGAGVTRLQVNVNTTLANRFKKAALERGMAHTDLLLQLIRDTVT